MKKREESAEEESLAEGEPGAGEPSSDPLADLQVQKRIAELESEAASHRDRYLRAVADAENMKKRLAREKADAIRFGNEALLRDVLPVLDNLELAIEHADPATDGKSVVEGVELTLRMFRDVLERHGLKPIEATAGSPFDPNVHEASGIEPTSAFAPNSVVRQLQRGYFLHDRLLRPARVTVAGDPGGSA